MQYLIKTDKRGKYFRDKGKRWRENNFNREKKKCYHCRFHAHCDQGMKIYFSTDPVNNVAELAQSVERTTLNRVVVGSIPTFGVTFSRQRRRRPFIYPTLQPQYLYERRKFNVSQRFLKLMIILSTRCSPKIEVLVNNLALQERK